MVDLRVIRNILDNLEDGKVQLFEKVWTFWAEDYVPWESFVERMKNVSYSYLKQRAERFAESVTISEEFKGRVTFDQ